MVAVQLPQVGDIICKRLFTFAFSHGLGQGDGNGRESLDDIGNFRLYSTSQP